uniref:Uncharacterized protein n=1 Tax=Lepeophtheirus salmonis TaxID=72036 RepID=A0A0K2V282_LEPSM
MIKTHLLCLHIHSRRQKLPIPQLGPILIYEEIHRQFLLVVVYLNSCYPESVRLNEVHICKNNQLQLQESILLQLHISESGRNSSF